jgi:L-seryl-tRNA(Ser) seleniumtransferase
VAGSNQLQKIPKVDKVLEWEGIIALLPAYPRPVVLKAIRTVLEGVRSRVLGGEAVPGEFAERALIGLITEELATSNSLKLKRLVNGTGIVIHTNLGRSPLPQSVRKALDEVAFGYSNLEFDLAAGERGSRYAHVEGLICELTGAEAALVVNNNAAAVLLALSSLARRKEVIVSRGELVEIGGSFRIPDVMGQSGAVLKEVGTTNRTHPRDYSGAVTPETGLFLKIHCSNFAVIGFTAEVSAAQLAALGREHSIPVMADVGSGSIADLSKLLGCDEPTVQEFVRAGVDVITFSGDKLLGGPQAGIIVGRKELLAPMKKHPLLRAVRIDKMTLAALEGTLQLYRDERRALAEIPTLRMLTASAAELSQRAKTLLRRLRRAVPPAVKLALLPGFSQAGGGALPLLELPTTLLSVQADGLAAQDIEITLRSSPVPVIGRIAKGAYLLDPRTIQQDDIPALIEGLRALAK